MGISMFKPNTTKPTVSILEICAPEIIITKRALTKMQIYVNTCDNEVGWLGIAIKEDKYIYIEDVLLFEQEVHATTTEITPEGLATFGEKLLADYPDNGMEIWNNIKVWGHSHVNMSTFASGQDDKQMETFAEGGHDWFIRIIANKKGDMNIDIYDYSLGIIYKGVIWKEGITEEETKILKQIKFLQQKIKEINKNFISKYEFQIKKEIKEKVKEIKTVVTGYQYGRNWQPYNYQSQIPSNNYDTDDIKTYADVYKLFEDDLLYEIGQCKSYKDASVIILTFDESLSSKEVNLVWEVGQAYYKSHKGGTAK